MSGFNLDDYVDVAERIRLFYERYPDGRLLTVEHGKYEVGERTFVYCMASAYRTPEDVKPCKGIAWEPMPGATPYTRDSELMNAETAAWGRAIIAAGIPSKKIASAQEVRNRASSESPSGPGDSRGSGNGGSGESRKTKPELLAYLSDILVALKTQAPQTDWTEKARKFSKEHYETTKSQELTKPQLESLVLEAEKWLVHLETEDVPFG